MAGISPQSSQVKSFCKNIGYSLSKVIWWGGRDGRCQSWHLAKEIFGYIRFYGYLCITYISPGEALFRRQYVIILNPTHYNKTDK